MRNSLVLFWVGTYRNGHCPRFNGLKIDFCQSPFIMKAIWYEWQIVAIMNFVWKGGRFEHEVVFYTKDICDQHGLGDPVFVLHFLHNNGYVDNDIDYTDHYDLH